MHSYDIYFVSFDLVATILQNITYIKKISSSVNKLRREHCLKEELRTTLSVVQRVSTAIANYKFSEKIYYLKPWTIMFQFNRIRQEIVSLFNFIKHFAYTLCIFVRSIYMFSFSQSAFSQISSRYHLRNLATCLVFWWGNVHWHRQHTNFWILESVSHVQIEIGDN